MVFKRCTIDGADYDHNSGIFSKSGGEAGKGGDSKNAAGRRASLEPNPMLSHTLSLTASQVAGDFARAHKVQEFFLLLAVCNTVIVAKQPHKDNMNASGFICASSAPSTTSSARKQRVKKRDAKVTIAPMSEADSINQDSNAASQDDVDDNGGSSRRQSPSPPPSLMSTSSSTAPLHPALTFSDGAPLSPPASASTITQAATPLRPNRLLPTDHTLFPCSTKPSLSPIASSPEITPTADQMLKQEKSDPAAQTAPPTPVTSKSKILNLPSLLNRFVSPTPNASRTGTPLPTVKMSSLKY